jgi:hypothetical protein
MRRASLKAAGTGVLAAAAISLAGCGSVTGGNSHEPPSLAGTWTPSDGTQAKVFNDDGSCEGAYYADGRPLDIGGPMSCHMSSGADASGRYKLLVTQGPNESTYLVEFKGANSASVYTTSGKLLYTLTRF